MKIYNCDVCGNLTYFENTLCVNCQSPLGYLPIVDSISALEAVDITTWKALAPRAQGAFYKKCGNYQNENICNWMIPINYPGDLCISCELNETIPDLSVPDNRNYWHKLETAKRRLVYSLLRFGLPVKSKKVDPLKGIAFSFLADEVGPTLEESEKVLTGHDEGHITLNINEANDATREKMRLDMNERYRTLLGHFRHEIGHYYWFLLIEDDPNLLAQFRNTFGDEKQSYDEMLTRYYQNGPLDSWQQNYISAYASSHPWEDWAESWAHYFHMVDTIETARSWGLTTHSKGNEESLSVVIDPSVENFDDLKNQWMYLSSALNSLNRSMGMKDVYPFVWSDAVVNKLRFIQQLVASFQPR